MLLLVTFEGGGTGFVGVRVLIEEETRVDALDSEGEGEREDLLLGVTEADVEDIGGFNTEGAAGAVGDFVGVLLLGLTECEGVVVVDLSKCKEISKSAVHVITT